MELEYPFLENKPILPDDHNTMTHIDACYRNQKEMVKDEYVAAVLAGHPKCIYRNPVAIYQRCISDYSPTPNRSTEFSNERTVVHV